MLFSLSTTSLESWRRSYGFVLIATVAVVFTADSLLYNHRLGWCAALVAAALLGVLALRDMSFLAHAAGKITWAAAAGLLLALFEQPTMLNILFMLASLAVLALINSSGWDSDAIRWLRRIVRWFLIGWTRLFRDNGIVTCWLIRRGLSPTLARGIAAWIIPVLFTAVFVAIFAWANPIISDFFSRLGTFIGDVIDRLPEILNIARLLFWLCFATFAWSLMRSRTRRRGKRADGMTADELNEWIAATRAAAREHNSLGLPASMVIRCLILFNLVFAIENVLDSRILWWRTLPAGFNYTQYVHRGAYPLVAAALLAGAFVLLTFNPHSSTERSPWARRLVYFWIGQTIFLTCTAIWRLMRYVELTELTRLRFASAVWFLLVALGLVLIIWRIVRGRSNRWLVSANALATLLVLYPCCFINFDGIIADYNVRHCREAGGRGLELSIEYLRHLGPAALPALDAARDTLTTPTRRALARNYSQELHDQLEDDLRDWHAWTWRRERIMRQADEVRIARRNVRWQLAQGVTDVSR